MPELSDVELFRHYIQYTVLFKMVINLEVYSSDILEEISQEKLKS
jgi:hypothetical protein